jgi:DNA replication initiation complex subunit (GINS family)
MTELTYEELYELSLKEKEEGLIELPETFYRDVANMILAKKFIMDKDGLTSDEKTEVEDEIRNIKRIQSNITERRVTKIMLSAIDYSKSGLMLKPNIYGKELELFDSIVNVCKDYRQRLV